MSINLYRIYNLDRAQPPEVLAQRLGQQLAATDPGDSLTRSRIETAQAILGDPSRRAIYDAQLGDPAAPPITEQTLAALAGRPVPSTPHTLGSFLATMQGKLIAGAAAALVLILLVVIAVVAVSGGDDDGGTAVTASSSSGSRSSGASGEVRPNSEISYASWGKKDSRPSSALVLTKETPLPAEFDSVTDLPTGQTPPCSTDGTSGGLVQYQDRSVGFIFPKAVEEYSNIVDYHLAALNPEGDVVSTTTYAEKEQRSMPQVFDLMKQTTKGYARVEATDGITIPAGAAGDEGDKFFVTCALPDAFDETLLWVTMRGSASVYQAQIRNVGT